MSRKALRKVKGSIQLKKEFGFLIVDTEEGEEPQDDLFVASECLGSAMDGDYVEARVEMRRGRQAAVVEKVLERASDRIVGIIDSRGRERVLVCEETTDPIEIAFDDKSVAKEELHGGYRAVGRITRFPTEFTPARVVIEEVLGKAGEPDVELAVSRFKHSVPYPFPQSVLDAVAQIPDEIHPKELKRRRDVRDISTFTIDPNDARDFDDAISIEPSPKFKGGFRIGIHIADVSHYVTEKSAIDNEAYKRGTSVYLPGEVVPMLPERLSNQICSLIQDEDKLTSSVIVDFDAALRPQKYSHHRTVIRSNRRFTYEEVDEILESGKGDFADELKTLERIGKSLNQIRMTRGAIDFDTTEKKPVLGPNKKVIDVRVIERTWSHRLIEELMLLANEYVARQFTKKGIFRIHEPPADVKLSQLRRFLGALGRPIHSMNLQDILDSFRDSPAQPVVQHMVLRSMQEAKYSHINRGHFGLASKAYTHFTSPIRRYPDLIVHRLLFGDKCKRPLAKAGTDTSKLERKAVAAEREAVTIKLIEYALDHLGDTAEGVIDNVTKAGLFISLDFGPRGLLPALDLGNEDYRFVNPSKSLVGRKTGRTYKIGDRITVQLAAVDFVGRTLYLLPEDFGGKRGARPSGKPERRTQGDRRESGRKRSSRGGKSRGKSTTKSRGQSGGPSGGPSSGRSGSSNSSPGKGKGKGAGGGKAGGPSSDRSGTKPKSGSDSKSGSGSKSGNGSKSGSGSKNRRQRGGAKRKRTK